MHYYSCGEVIKRLRKSKGLTQEELAFGICSVSTLSKIENGRQTPHYSTFKALLRRVDISLDEDPYNMDMDHLRCYAMIIGDERADVIEE